MSELAAPPAVAGPHPMAGRASAYAADSSGQGAAKAQNGRNRTKSRGAAVLETDHPVSKLRRAMNTVELQDSMMKLYRTGKVAPGPSREVVDSIDRIRSQLSEAAKHKKYLLDPRTSNFLNAWDSLTGLALVYTVQRALLVSTRPALQHSPCALPMRTPHAHSPCALRNSPTKVSSPASGAHDTV